MNRPGWIGYALNGRYKVEEMLGQGGMSAVYRASDPNLKRPVAVKLIHNHLSSDPEFVRRFELEAAAVAQLRHPNIVQVYDYNQDGADCYMVLEYIPGGSLQAQLSRLNNAGLRLPLERVVKLGLQICAALDYAHQRGMIHRDVKPANVLLNGDDQAILTDFGVVKMLAGEQHTASGALVGTASYMAPEQIRGLPFDHRVDLYSLGVMLYEPVTGRCPFESESTMSLMLMHLNEPVPDVRQFNPQVPPALQAVIETALAKDPAGRFASAAEMSAALTRAWTEIEAVVGLDTPEKPIIASQVQAAIPTAVLPGTALTNPLPAVTISPSPTARPAASAGWLPTALWILAGAALIVLLVVVFVIPNLPGAQPAASPTHDMAAMLVSASTSTPTLAPTKTPLAPAPTATETLALAPAATATHTPTPTLSPTPSGKYAQITSITLEDGRYVVAYVTFNFTERLPGDHVHFFFDTVTSDQAGLPGQGPWKIYGGPRPFIGLTVADRPTGAERMCVLVANSDHTIVPDSGNCFDLPE